MKVSSALSLIFSIKYYFFNIELHILSKDFYMKTDTTDRKPTLLIGVFYPIYLKKQFLKLAYRKSLKG